MPKKSHVVILGAGLAGLTAGYYLNQKGVRVTILEARDRVGGRVYTQTIDKDENLTVELGAEWIGKTHRRMLDLCKKFQLPLINHHLEPHLILSNKYYPPRKWHFSKKWEKKLHSVLKNLLKLSPEEIQKLDSIDWWHFLIINHIPMRDLEIQELFDTMDYGESARFISAYDLLRNHLNGGYAEVSDYWRIKNGNSALPQKLAAALGTEAVLLEKKVKSIKQNEKEVLVTCQDGRALHADWVISTLPTYALFTLFWRPALPIAQERAFQTLNYSRISKSSVLFSNRFWKQDDFEVITDHLPHQILHSTQNQPGKKGVLTSYSGGDRALIISNLNEHQRMNEICDTLSLAFGSVRHYALTGMSYYWGDDPYTKGAFSFFEKGQSFAFRQLLRQHHGRVVFAGEHTGDMSGFMEGAVESGERAAAEILQRISLT